MGDKLIRLLVHPAAGISVALALVLAAFSASTLQMDNRLNRMLDPTAEQALLYQRFLDDYASDEFVIVAISGKPLFSYESLDAMLAAQEALEAIPEAAHVTGLPQIFRDRFGAEDPEALRAEMTSTPFYQNLFINERGDVAGIVVEAKPLESPETRTQLTRGVETAVQPLIDYGFRVDIAGGPVFDTEINTLSMGESMRYFPIAAVASLLMLLMLLRSGRAAMAVVLCGGASILLTLGLLAATGEPLNIVTSALPLILWVLSLASCIHVVTRFQFHFGNGRTRRDAIIKSLNDVAGPCTLSAVTTAAGFLSLMLAEIPPIRALGMWMAIGLMAALLVNLTLCPALLLLFRARGARWLRPKGGRPFHQLANWSIGRRYAVLTVFALVFIATVVAIPFVRPQHDSLGFLPEGSAVTKSYQFVGEELTGLDAMDVLIATPGSWLEPDYWPAIEAFAEEMAQRPYVARVISPLEFLKKTREWYAGRDAAEYQLPASREEAEHLLSQVDLSDQDHINRVIHRSGEEIRLTVLISSTDARQFLGRYEDAQALLLDLPEPLSAVITGRSPQMQHMEKQLVVSQIKTFSAAFVAILLCLIVGLRSFRLLVAAIPPNLLPVLAVFGMMALIGIPLDAGTVMVASIAMGIAVDDTVHVLAAFRRRRKGGELARAIKETLFDVGPSITVTTFTAAAGFYCLTLSIFNPLQYFGILAGTALILALITDVIALPAMLAMLYRIHGAESRADVARVTRKAA